MEEERKDIQETAGSPETETVPEIPGIPEMPDIPVERDEPEPVRDSPRRLNRNGKRSTEPRSLAARDVALLNLIEQVENEHTRDYIENRILTQMQWYSKKSAECKNRYQYCMTAAIVLGALIPVFTVSLTEGPITIRIIIALLGTSVTAINAYLSLHNSKDLWLNYRNTRENLLRTLYYYFNNAGNFREGTQEEKDARLIDRCEAELACENGTWRSVMENQGANIGQQG